MLNRKRSLVTAASLLVAAMMVIAVHARPALAQDGYYKVQPIYIPFPVPGKTWPMLTYGPVGIGIDLGAPAFTMKVRNVEKGSPAEAAGLKKGQVIESINGQTLKDIDPRVQLANILTEAEATDGLMKFQVKGAGEVVVKLPVLGRYSDTWPVNCPKSDRIVRNLADALARQENPGWGSVLFLLSTGEEQDLAVVRKWMGAVADRFEKDGKAFGAYPWHNGMIGMGVCEYYLRTGDQRMLPVIKRMTEYLKEQIYCGGWSGRGKASFTYVAGGQLSAAGVPCLTFLLLARQCGVDVDEHTFQSALRQFFRFAGRGNVAYGDHMPEGGYRDNGKTAALALAMSAAAELMPDPEASIYARARDNSAMKSFYASSWFNRAHTGGGIGEMWHANAMQLVRETKPTQWRSFMDERRWHFELSRRFDGSIGIHDGQRYDQSATQSGRSWGTIHALIYTAHRKKLRIFGAPPTEFCKKYTLPERPWGTPADDIFQSLEPAEYAPGRRMDISGETIPTDASARFMARMGQPDFPEDQLWQYLHHPEYGFRVATMRTVVRRGLDPLVLRALQSPDPRVREVGVEAIAGMFKGRPLPDDRITDEMWQLIGAMVEDPDESWFVTCQAMKALGRAPARHVAPHVDRLVHFVEHDDWWMHTTAMTALAGVAADERYYRKVLPAVAEVVKTQRSFQSTAAVGPVIDRVKKADAAVQKFALGLFGEAYFSIPDPIVAPGGQITPNQTQVIRDRALSFMRSLKGSEDIILKMPKLTSNWQASRLDSHKYTHTGRFTPNTAVLGKWKVVDQVKSIDEFTYDKKRNPGKPPYRAITFNNGGKTDNANRVWSGRVLIDLGRNEALRMIVRPVRVPPNRPGDRARAEPFLFIEAGGFGETKPRDWKTPYYVLEKVN